MTDRFNAKLLHLLLACVMVVGLQACSHLPTKSVATNASLTTSAAVWQPEDQMAWERVRIPGKVATQYSVVKVSNRSTLKATAQSSASMLRKDLRPHNWGNWVFLGKCSR
jgi:starvation-inducible outer membrane lipoprotein